MKIKVCGMKYPENIEEISQLEIDYLGFIFYKNSPRNMDKVFKLPTAAKKVGVFVNAECDFIIEKSKIYELDVIQLHGEETPEFCQQLSIQLSEKYHSDTEIWKAFAVQNSSDLEVVDFYNFYVNKFLLDAKGSKKGGNGIKFNWDILKHHEFQKPIVLSGGISEDDAESIADLSASNKISAVDVNSKFEIEPGMKDEKRLSSFIQNIKIL